MKEKKTKKNRQKIIEELIESQEIGTQEELLAKLAHQGISVTQATLSRDLRAMGVTKVPKGLFKFVYKIAGEETSSTERDLRNKFNNFVREIKHTNNLIVIKTLPGEAMGVARIIDNAKLDGLMGTVAGDDTILIIVNNVSNTKKTINFFHQVMTKP